MFVHCIIRILISGANDQLIIPLTISKPNCNWHWYSSQMSNYKLLCLYEMSKGTRRSLKRSTELILITISLKRNQSIWLFDFVMTINVRYYPKIEPKQS